MFGRIKFVLLIDDLVTLKSSNSFVDEYKSYKYCIFNPDNFNEDFMIKSSFYF